MHRHRRLALQALLAAACGCSLPAPAPRPAALDPDRLVDADLVADGTGNVYGAVVERRLDAAPRVLVLASASSGQRWERPVELGGVTSGDRRRPRLATGGPGRVYVLWEDSRTGPVDLRFNRSLDGGAGWLAEDLRLNTAIVAGSRISSPALACDPYDNLVVVWLDRREGFDALYANRSRDAGDTWLESERRITRIAFGDKGAPRIASDEDGVVYVAWAERAGGAPEVHVNVSTDHGETWMLDDRVPSLGVSGVAPEICALRSGVAVLAWVGADFGVHASRTVDRGENWSAPQRLGAISPRLPSPGAVQVRGDGRDQVYIAWMDRDRRGSRALVVAASADAGARYTLTTVPCDNAVEPLVDLSGDTSSSGVAFRMGADRTGSVYLVWLETTTASIRMHFERVANYGRGRVGLGNVLEVPLRADLRLPLERPHVAGDDAGHVCLLWNSGAQLHLAESPFSGDSGWRLQEF